MKLTIASLLALFLLTGCSVSKPGGFVRVDEDPSANTVQYRYDPHKLNKDALQLAVAEYCNKKGFDKVEALPPENSHIPGLKTNWYQCNYAVKQ